MRHNRNRCPDCHDARLIALDRSRGICERCGENIYTKPSASVHHRQPRGMGGRKRCDTAAELAVLCGSGTTGCHGTVESHRADAREKGWLVPQRADAATVPVLTWQGWRLFLPDGCCTPVRGAC